MLVGGMIYNKVNDYADPALLSAVGELDEIAECSISGIYAIVVRNIVAIIAAWRALERHEPEGRDAQAMKRVETSHQPLEVTNTVAVGIHIGADGKAINDRVFVPKGFEHRGVEFYADKLS